MGKFNNQISNHDIDNVLKDIPNYRGCFSKINLPNTLKDGTYIVNLDNDRGTHWTSLIYKKKSNICEYFDSFGILPPKDVIEFIGNKKMIYSSHHIQNISSSNCGFYCIYFIIERIIINKKPLDILLKFTNDGSIKNDKILFNELQQYI